MSETNEVAAETSAEEVRVLETGTLIALVDPLCGWCWGAVPAFEKMAAAGLPLEIVCSGLFIGDRPMTPEFADYAWQSDQRIGLMTGQIFSREYNEKVLRNFDTKFDSGPATLAVTAVQMREPEKALKVLHALQAARWVAARDITSEEVVATVLRESGVGRNTVEAFLSEDQEIIDELNNRANFARAVLTQVDARGVPTVVRVGERAFEKIDSRWLFEDVDAIVVKLASAAGRG